MLTRCDICLSYAHKPGLGGPSGSVGCTCSSGSFTMGFISSWVGSAVSVMDGSGTGSTGTSTSAGSSTGSSGSSSTYWAYEMKQNL